MTTQTLETNLDADIKILQAERPLFEANYVKLGGSLQFLKWDECHDGTGCYQVDWQSVSQHDEDFAETIQNHAEHVTSCLLSWVECAKSKAIPYGYYLLPIQPCQEMIESAALEFQDLDIDDIEDRVVFAHQAIIKVATLKSLDEANT